MLRHVYAAYALTAFALLAIVALLLILPVPWLSLRRRIARRFARIALAACGMRLAVTHPERLGPEPCIVVANHSSYLDGIVLYAALPPTFGFVIKREMSRVPLANLLLRRIGAHYVDRSRGHKGARDTRKLLRQANAGVAAKRRMMPLKSAASGLIVRRKRLILWLRYGTEAASAVSLIWHPY